MEKTADIKAAFLAADESMLPELMEKYKDDPRAGIQSEIKKAQKKLDALEKERCPGSGIYLHGHFGQL